MRQEWRRHEAGGRRHEAGAGGRSVCLGDEVATTRWRYTSYNFTANEQVFTNAG